MLRRAAQILMIVRKWLLEPDTATGCLSVKEAVLFLQRLAQLERSGATQGAIKVRLSEYYACLPSALGPRGQTLAASQRDAPVLTYQILLPDPHPMSTTASSIVGISLAVVPALRHAFDDAAA